MMPKDLLPIMALFMLLTTATFGFNFVHPFRFPSSSSSSSSTSSSLPCSSLSTSSSRQTMTTTMMMSEDYELDIGDYKNCQFKRLGSVKDNIAKFSLEATIDSKDLNSYLAEYKEEMKRRKVVFPGFRAGKLPPYVMGDVRKYLVCYGLETMLGTLCNANGLKLCSEAGGDIAFGDDSYYEEIFVDDFRGYGFQKQRDAWREGTDFNFKAEFFAVEENSSSEPEVVVVDTSKVVEATAVESLDGASTSAGITPVEADVDQRQQETVEAAAGEGDAV